MLHVGVLVRAAVSGSSASLPPWSASRLAVVQSLASSTFSLVS